MANKIWTDLDVATSVLDTDELLIDTAGNPEKVTKSILLTDTIKKTTDVESIDDTGIADNEIAIFDKTAKSIKTSNKVHSTDGTLASNSDANIPTEKAVKTYADTKIAKTTYVETIDDTGIEDGMVVVFDKTNKKLKKLGNVKIDSNGHFLSNSSSTSNKIGIGCTKTSGGSSFLMGEIKTRYVGSGWDNGCVILSNPSSSPYDTLPVDFLYLYQNSLGIGKVPGYQLDLSTDNARKLTTTTWITGSDERLKDNIELADLTRCYEIVKNLPLKRFKWKYYENQVSDLNVLGWIAQDVKKIFPKSITTSEIEIIPEKKEIIKKAEIDKNGDIIKEAEYKITQKRQVLKDGLSLNSDQINKVLYGAVQKLIEKEEAQQKEIDDLKIRLEKLEALINK